MSTYFVLLLPVAALIAALWPKKSAKTALTDDVSLLSTPELLKLADVHPDFLVRELGFRFDMLRRQFDVQEECLAEQRAIAERYWDRTGRLKKTIDAPSAAVGSHQNGAFNPDPYWVIGRECIGWSGPVAPSVDDAITDALRFGVGALRVHGDGTVERISPQVLYDEGII